MKRYTKEQTLRYIIEENKSRRGLCPIPTCSKCLFENVGDEECEFVRIRNDLGFKDDEYDDSVDELVMCVENSPV